MSATAGRGLATLVQTQMQAEEEEQQPIRTALCSELGSPPAPNIHVTAFDTLLCIEA